MLSYLSLTLSGLGVFRPFNHRFHRWLFMFKPFGLLSHVVYTSDNRYAYDASYGFIKIFIKKALVFK